LHQIPLLRVFKLQTYFFYPFSTLQIHVARVSLQTEAAEVTKSCPNLPASGSMQQASRGYKLTMTPTTVPELVSLSAVNRTPTRCIHVQPSKVDGSLTTMNMRTVRPLTKAFDTWLQICRFIIIHIKLYVACTLTFVYI
jgi:hypothetical protein